MIVPMTKTQIPPPTSATFPEPASRDVEQRATPTQSELSRKLLHVLPGFLPFGLAFLPHDDPPDWIALSVVLGITVLLTGVYLALRSRVSRAGEYNFFSSALSYPACVVGTLLLFPQHAQFAMVVVIVLAFGDGSAYFFGKRFGKRKLPWNNEKTWAGTLAFVLCSAPIAAWAFWLEAKNPEVSWLLAWGCCFTASLVAAIAESWPTRITDNLRVGLSAAVTVSGAYFLLS